MSESREALLVARLRARQPDGTSVGERERTCHLVPVSAPEAIPEFLTAYCGLTIGPGAAELLDGLRGMPCEACLAGSPIPAFSMLRQSWQPSTLPAEPVGQLTEWGLGR